MLFIVTCKPNRLAQMCWRKTKDETHSSTFGYDIVIPYVVRLSSSALHHFQPNKIIYGISFAALCTIFPFLGFKIILVPHCLHSGTQATGVYHVFIVNRKSVHSVNFFFLWKTECVRRICVFLSLSLSLSVRLTLSPSHCSSKGYGWTKKNHMPTPRAIFGWKICSGTAGSQFTHSNLRVWVCDKKNIVKIVICTRNKNYATIKSFVSFRSIWLIFALWLQHILFVCFISLSFCFSFHLISIHTLANNFTDTS